VARSTSNTPHQICLVFSLRPGAEEEYDRRHRTVWPELLEQIRAAGITQNAVLRTGTSVIVFVAHPDDVVAALARVGLPPRPPLERMVRRLDGHGALGGDRGLAHGSGRRSVRLIDGLVREHLVPLARFDPPRSGSAATLRPMQPPTSGLGRRRPRWATTGRMGMFGHALRRTVNDSRLCNTLSDG